ALRLPVVETLVYLGPESPDPESDEEPGFLFQYAASYYRDGDWNELSEDERYAFEEPPVISFPPGYKDDIVDAAGLIKELELLRARG
ncbi:MAG: hypothetical protein ABW220_16180, partial [Burkholderiaceae bacterium]